MVQPHLISENHPSFGCASAWFMFAVRNIRDNNISKILLVEAKNPWAVQTIERILLNDGKVSENCFILTVHRQCPTIGIRSDFVSEISYVDFMIDIVDPNRLLNDVIISTSFRKSISADEQDYALQKLEAAEKAAKNQRKSYRDPDIKYKPMDKNQRQELIYNLLNLGFDHNKIQSFIEGFGSKIDYLSNEEIMRAAKETLPI